MPLESSLRYKGQNPLGESLCHTPNTHFPDALRHNQSLLFIGLRGGCTSVGFIQWGSGWFLKPISFLNHSQPTRKLTPLMLLSLGKLTSEKLTSEKLIFGWVDQLPLCYTTVCQKRQHLEYLNIRMTPEFNDTLKFCHPEWHSFGAWHWRNTCSSKLAARIAQFGVYM